MSPADSPFAPLSAPGPHPATAELRAYAAGTLAPADEHRIEAHTLDCERCADLVEGFSMSDAATTDHAVAELRTRLQARIGTAKPVPVPARWAWPRLAAAAALLGVVGGGLWGWERYEAADSTTTVARLETASAAPEPVPASAAPAAENESVAAAPAATADAAQTTAKPADYAAVTPAQSARRATARPPFQASRSAGASSADDRMADASVVMADMEALPSIGAATEAVQGTAETQAAPASSAAPAGYGSAPARSQGLLQGRTNADDTAAPAREDDLASPKMKAKAAASTLALAEAPPASVPATPMPAAPAINPAPVVGTMAFREYLRREASGFIPEINNLRQSGTVRVRFVVGADGKVSDLKVMRGLRKDYDDEALRIVCEGPAWQPGIAGGKRAPLPVEVTVPF